MQPSDGWTSGAALSGCGQYRYRLWREWGDPDRRCLFVMLNPSTADAAVDDQTVRRCVGFARAWGFGALDVVNLFAWRATQPARLLDVVYSFEESTVLAHEVLGKPLPDKVVGPNNDEAIWRAVSHASRIVLAWGTHKKIQSILAPRAAHVRRRMRELNHCPVGHLGLCADGQPRHPLMLAAATPFVPYELAKQVRTKTDC